MIYRTGLVFWGLFHLSKSWRGNAHLFLFPVFLLLVIFILQSQSFAEFRVFFNAFHFHVDDCLRIRLDPVIVPPYLLHHDVVSLPVPEFINDRDRLICLLLRADLCMVDDDLRMKDFLVYLLPEIIRYGTDKGPLREVCYLGSRNKRVELRVDRGGHILTGDGYGLPLLEYFPEPL